MLCGNVQKYVRVATAKDLRLAILMRKIKKCANVKERELYWVRGRLISTARYVGLPKVINYCFAASVEVREK